MISFKGAQFPKDVILYAVFFYKSDANSAGLENINILLMLTGLISFVEILKVKYLNNLIEQDHRFIKKITKPMLGFMAFHSAKTTVRFTHTIYPYSL
jgi:putative transposase